jgi:DNA-binding IclR family transcriptional regulator
MGEPILRDGNLVRVYTMLVEGVAQARIVKMAKMDKGLVSRLAKELVRNGYLIKPKKRTRPIIYR